MQRSGKKRISGKGNCQCKGPMPNECGLLWNRKKVRLGSWDGIQSRHEINPSPEMNSYCLTRE